MKKINSHILSKERKDLFKNIWRRSNNNIKQIRPKKNDKIKSLSLFQEIDLQKNKRPYLSNSKFSTNNEFHISKSTNFNLLNIKDNFEIFSSVSNYLLNKKKKIADLNKFKELRQENLKKLLEESKSDQNILGKTFSTKFIDDEELKNLSEAYEKGHVKKIGFMPNNNFDEDNNSYFGKTQTQLFHKFNFKR